MLILFFAYSISIAFGSWFSKCPIRESFVAFMYVLGLFFLRPNILGENYGFLAPAFFLVAGIFASRNLGVSNPSRSIAKVTVWLVVWQLIYVAYMIFQSANLRAEVSVINLAKNTGSVSVALVVTAYLCRRNFATTLVKMYVYVLFSLSIFSVVSTALVIAGVSGCIHITGTSRNWDYVLCAPGGVFVGRGYYSVGNLSALSRLTGVGGEPAVFSVEIALAAVLLILYAPIFTKKVRQLAMLSFLISTLLTQSVTGLVLGLLGVVMAVTLKFERKKALKRFVVLVLSPFAVKFLTNLSHFKREIDTTSVNDRFKNLSFSDYVNYWVASPLGDPIYGFGQKNVGVNALGLSLLIGPFIFFLIAAIYLLPPFVFQIDKKLLIPASVLSGCVIFSQPPFQNQLWIVLLGLVYISGSAMKIDS